MDMMHPGSIPGSVYGILLSGSRCKFYRCYNTSIGQDIEGDAFLDSFPNH